MTEDELVQMIEAAYEAGIAENMNCPWCSGRLRVPGEHHDEFCPLEKFRRWARSRKEVDR